MERQSTSKLYRALIAVVAFFVLCTSAILFASCGTDPRECKHEHLDESDVIAYELATCGTPGTVTYECSDCGAAVTVIGTLATGEHNWANGKCTFCGIAEGSQGLSLKEVKDLFATLATQESMLATQKSLEQLTTLVNKLATQDSVDKLASQESIKELKDLVDKLASQESVDKLASQESIKELKDLVDKLATTDYIDELTQAKFKEIGDELTALKAQLNEVQTQILDSLTKELTTIPDINEKLEEVLASVKGLGDLDIDLDLDLSEISFLADGNKDTKVTLADVITALYKQVHQLFIDYSSASEGSLYSSLVKQYNLLVSADGTHVHNWVLKLKTGTTPSCTEPNTYVWGCAFCTATQPGAKEVTINATGHATEFKTGLKDAAHHFDATCITGARVEGYCANCKQYTGEWTTVGVGTGKHNYVLEEEHSKTGSCTQVGTKVYHCATCGGAYVEETKAPGHEYYYKLDENGNKVKLEEAEKEQILQDYYGEDKDLSALTEEEKGVALQPYLNVVYSSPATCVDPGLVVVECLECGVRYSYTTGEKPTGHSFVAHKQDANSCVENGIAGYAYCSECGYFFFCNVEDEVRTAEKLNADGTEPAGAVVGPQVGWYSRNYIRKDGKVIHYVLGEGETIPMAQDPEALEEDETADPALVALFEVTSAALPAAGHSYVPVYINTADCVTAQRYILVCEKCFSIGKGDAAEDFDHLTQDMKYESDAWVNDTADANVGDTVYFKHYKNGTTDYYTLNALVVGDNVGEVATTAVKNAISLVVNAAKPDSEEPEEGKDPVYSDLTLAWNEAFEGGKTAIIDFFVAHQGYLNRDPKDDDQYAQGNSKDAKAKLVAQLEKLTEEELEALFVPFNVVIEVDEDAEVEDDTVAYKETEFANPVQGHKFTEKYVTVVGGCTLYERHVLFCTVCGADTLTDGESDGPATVTGVSDVAIAGYDDPTDAPEGFKTDLQLEWEAVVASLPQIGSGLLDDEDDAPTANWGFEAVQSTVFPWLLQHGYLNDYRDGDLSKAPDNDEMSRTLLRVGELYMAKLVEAMEDPRNFDSAKFDEDFWTAFYTQQNVLDEFKVTSVYGTVVEGEGDDANVVRNDTEIVLGHKFDTIVYVGVGETCDEPASYVYVCSECNGLSEADDPYDKFNFNSGAETVTVPYVQKVKSSKTATFVTDAEVWEESTMEDRRDGDLAVDDLEAEFNALETEDQFDWLLAKGYLNGVIDSVMLYGYKDKNGNHVKGALETAAETADKTQKGWLGKLFANKTTKTGIYYDYYNVVETKVSETKVVTTVTFNSAKKGEIQAAAEAIALAGGYGTTTADLTKFYTQSGDGFDADGNALDVAGEAANKTSEVAAVAIPESGHLWLNEKGDTFVEGDPACVDFASTKLKEIFDGGNYPEWVPAVKETNGTTKAGTGIWKASTRSFTYTVSVPGEWSDTLSDLEKFLWNVNKYGIIAACSRSADCPLQNSNDDITPTTAFGFYAAVNHVESYEKFKEATNTDPDVHYPSATIETINDGEHVYYNMKTMTDYRNPEDAAKYLESGSTWETLAAQETDTTKTEAQRDKATEALNKAAQAAMDHDVHNLTTLQHIWNTLFVDFSWRYPTNATTGKHEFQGAQGILARDKAYPLYLPAMKKSTTETVLDAEGKPVVENGKEVKYTLYSDVDYAMIAELFAEDNKVAPLWKGTLDANSTPVWRPLNDHNEKSCWIDLRCQWYHASKDGTKCTKGSPQRSHSYPLDCQGAYDWESHLANCRHVDLCMTCGMPIGESGTHNLVVTISEKETNETYKTAWLAIVKASMGTLGNKPGSTATAAALSRWYLLDSVHKAVEILHGATDKTLTWEDWQFKTDSCWTNGESGTKLQKDVGYEVKLCSGELEIIAENLAKNVAWDTDVTWNYASETVYSPKVTATNPNCNVEVIDSAQHGWVADKEGKTNTETRYFYILDYVNVETGVQIGYAGKPIYVDEATKTIVNKDVRGDAVQLTDDLIKKMGVNPIEFTDILCTAGYYTQEFCQNVRQNEEKCECVNSATDGSEDDASSKYRHTATGHLYAPVEEYWNSVAGRGYQPATNDTNAYVDQVCTNCGLNAQGIWGTNVAVGVTGSRPQFGFASSKQISDWNDHVDTLGSTTLKRAQEIRPTDVAKGETPAADGFQFTTGQHVYKDTTILGVGTSSSSGETVLTVTEGMDVTMLVGKNATLTFDKLADGSTAYIKVQGTLAIVGELDDNGAITSTVDFSDLASLGTDGGDIILKNIKVKLGDCVINPGAKYGTAALGGAIEINNAIIAANNSVLGMAHDATGGTNVVTIDNSTLVSTNENTNGDFALAVFKENVTIKATDSKFFGAWGGAFIRSGTANFVNCEFYMDSTLTSDKTATWGGDNGTMGITSRAALLIGNQKSGATYGDAVVTLEGCTFGQLAHSAYNNFVLTTTGATACDGTHFAIEAFADADSTTEVTLDTKTFLPIPAGAISLHDTQVPAKDAEGKEIEGKFVSNLTFNYPTLTAADLGENAEAQAAKAEEVVDSVLASGGNITLPQIKDPTTNKLVPLDFTTESAPEAKNPLHVEAGTSASVDLGGNVLNIESPANSSAGKEHVPYNNVEGNLTITNGTINGNTEENASDAVDFSVTAGGSLTLKGVTAYFSENGGILVSGQEEKEGDTVTKAAGEVVIDGSKIIGVQQVICTNNDQTKNAKIVIRNRSEIIAMGGEGDNISLSTALLVNNAGVTVEASDSKFFGTSNAVWVRAGNATFTNCQFITGGWRAVFAEWGTGNTIMKDAFAALVVGDSDTATSYGDAYVRINGSSSVIRGYYKADDKKSTVSFNADGSIKDAKDITDISTAKRFVVASDANDSTTVIFQNENLVKNFTAETVVNAGTGVEKFSGLVKGKNAFYPENVAGDIHVYYVTKAATADTEEKTEPVEVEIPATDADGVKEAVKDAAQSGGKIVFPVVEEGPLSVTLNDALTVEEGKDVKIELNAKDVLDLGENVATVEKNGGLTITGGTVKGKIEAGYDVEAKTEVGGTITLNNVNVEGGVSSAGGAHVVINNSKISAAEADDEHGYGFVVGYATKNEGGKQVPVAGNLEAPQVIELTNTTITTGANTDAEALFVNGNCKNVTLKITNCNILGSDIGLAVMAGKVEVSGGAIYGGRIATLVRGGEVSFTNTTFIVGQESEQEGWAPADNVWGQNAAIGKGLEGALVIAASVGYEQITISTSGCRYYEAGFKNATAIEGGLYTSASVAGAQQVGNSGYYYPLVSGEREKANVVIGVMNSSKMIELKGDLETETFIIGQTAFYYATSSIDPKAATETTRQDFRGKVSPYDNIQAAPATEEP